MPKKKSINVSKAAKAKDQKGWSNESFWQRQYEHDQRDDCTAKPSCRSRSLLYVEYKQATEAFKQSLAALIAPDLLGSKVFDLVRAVESIVSRRTSVSHQLLATLRSATRIRQRVSKTYQSTGRGDEGHDYFVQVLQYCYQCLRPLVVDNASEKHQRGTSEVETDTMLNQFEALAVDDDEEPDETDVATKREGKYEPMQRPQEPATDYSIQDDLIDGSDSFFACTFLDTLNSLVGEVCKAYASLKQLCRQGHSKSLAFELMKCAAVVNVAVQELRYAEQVLMAERPHLNTIYRIIASGLFPDIINQVVGMMHGDKKDKMRQAATSIVGDCMDFQVALREDKRKQWLQSVKKFDSRWMSQNYSVSHFCVSVQAVLMYDAGLIDDEQFMEYTRFEKAEDGNRIKRDHLFGNFEYLAANRSIVQTLFCLENFNTTEVCLQVEEQGLQERFLGDFSTKSLAIPIIGSVIIQFAKKIKSNLRPFLPYESILLPLLSELRGFISFEAIDRPPTISLIFLAHVILTAAIEQQGDSDCYRLSMAGKLSFARYIREIDQSCKRPNLFVRNIREETQSNLFIKFLVSEEKEPPTCPGIDEVAFWNPYVAGMVLLYTCMYNLYAGYAQLTRGNRLTVALHLSHALGERGFQLPDSPIICLLEQLFGESKQVWAVQPRPKQGEFATHFFLACGLTPDVAKANSKKFALMWLHCSDGSMPCMKRRSAFRTRRDRLGKAKDISRSFRYIVHSDFSEILQTSNVRDSGEWIGGFRQQVSEILSSLDAEKTLLTTNLYSLALDLCQVCRPTLTATGCKVNEDTENIGPDTADFSVAACLSGLDLLDEFADTKLFDDLKDDFVAFIESVVVSKYEYFV